MLLLTAFLSPRKFQRLPLFRRSRPCQKDSQKAVASQVQSKSGKLASSTGRGFMAGPESAAHGNRSPQQLLVFQPFNRFTTVILCTQRSIATSETGEPPRHFPANWTGVTRMVFTQEGAANGRIEGIISAVTPDVTAPNTYTLVRISEWITQGNFAFYGTLVHQDNPNELRDWEFVSVALQQDTYIDNRAGTPAQDAIPGSPGVDAIPAVYSPAEDGHIAIPPFAVWARRLGRNAISLDESILLWEAAGAPVTQVSQEWESSYNPDIQPFLWLRDEFGDACVIFDRQHSPTRNRTLFSTVSRRRGEQNVTYGVPAPVDSTAPLDIEEPAQPTIPNAGTEEIPAYISSLIWQHSLVPMEGAMVFLRQDGSIIQKNPRFQEADGSFDDTTRSANLRALARFQVHKFQRPHELIPDYEGRPEAFNEDYDIVREFMPINVGYILARLQRLEIIVGREDVFIFERAHIVITSRLDMGTYFEYRIEDPGSVFVETFYQNEIDAYKGHSLTNIGLIME